MKKIKVIIACILCIIMVMPANVVSVSASDICENTNESDIGQKVIECAKKWIEMSEPNQGINKINVEKIYNIATHSYNYTVSYYADLVDYGYIIIGIDSGEPYVVEAMVDKGVKGIRKHLEETIDNIDNYGIKAELVEIAPLRYGIVAKEGKDSSNGVIIDDRGELLQYVDYGNATFDDVGDVIIESMPSDMYKIDQTSVKWLPKFAKKHKLFSLKETAMATGLYACGPQALLQISFMEGLYIENEYEFTPNAFLTREYGSLWNMTNTKYTGKTNSIGLIYYKSGEGSMKDAVNGYVKYVKSKKCTNNAVIKEYSSLADIKNGLKKNKSMLMGYGIIDKDGKRKGHFVSILGYKEAVEISSGNKYSYLAVADGWNENVAYINFKYAKEFKDYQVAYFNIIH